MTFSSNIESFDTFNHKAKAPPTGRADHSGLLRNKSEDDLDFLSCAAVSGDQTRRKSP